MLKNLSIKNFAIIENYNLSFGEGLNIITGETGSGKSILLKALGGLIGEKISSDYIRKGSDLADLQASFVMNSKEVSAFLSEHELASDDNENEIQIRKVIKKESSKVWINSVPVSNQILSQLGKFLIQALSQNQQQKLTSTTEQLKLLNKNIDPTLFSDLVAHLSVVRETHKSLEKINKDSVNKEERIAYIQHLLKDFSQFDLSLSEEDIESKINFLENAQFFAKEFTSLEQIVDSDDGASSQLELIRKSFTKLNAKNNSKDFEEALSLANQAIANLGDIFSIVQKNKKMLSLDDDELAELNQTASLLKKLKNKYGSLENVKEQIKKLNEELEYLENLEDLSETSQSQIDSLNKKIQKITSSISLARKNNAKSLEKKINQELQTLHMQGAKVKILITEQDANSSGADKVEFQISSNLGEDFKPLSQIASGGELSRIMLAIHQSLNEKERACFLLDEVDQGISGNAGTAVGQKLAELASQNQVIAITHLAQVAIFADQHIFISKSQTSAGRVASEAKSLNSGETEVEIARLIGNSSSQQSSLKHAKELLNSVK